MVFDECHHTRKRHAFNAIMHEYFHTPSDLRPKIFGMTASPISDPEDPAASLAMLESNLDAKVLAVQEHADELLTHSPKPAEVSGRVVCEHQLCLYKECIRLSKNIPPFRLPITIRLLLFGNVLICFTRGRTWTFRGPAFKRDISPPTPT